MVTNPPEMQETRRDGFDPWVGKISWRRKWQPTSVIFPRKILWTGPTIGPCSLAGYSPWGCKEPGTIEKLNNNNNIQKIPTGFL